MNQLNDFFPWDEKAAQDEWLQGIYHVKVVFTDGENVSSSGLWMPKVGFQCLQPAEWAHLSHFENYVISTAEQPTEAVKGTRGLSNLMKLAIAAQVPQTNKLSDLMISLKGAELLVAMSYKPGQDFPNNITSYYRLGERPVGLANPGAAARPVATAPTAAAPPPSTPPPAPAATTAPPPPAAPVAETTAPAAETPAEPKQTTAPAADGAMMRCTICQQDVPAAQFGAHIQGHAG